MIAFSLDGEVGIDIEKVRPVQPTKLAKYCFSAREQAELVLSRDDEQLRAFFRGWVRKESFIKALGLGLSYPLNGFDVSLADSSDNVLLRYTADSELLSKGWKTYSITTEPGFAAALTLEENTTEFRFKTATIYDLLRLSHPEV